MTDDETIWLQISAGRGPAECQLAVLKLATEIETRAKAAGLVAEVIELVAGEERGTALSALLKLAGPDVAVFAGRWHGSVQWIVQSPFRPSHKRKNWFVSVEILGEMRSDAACRIDPRDVSFESMRSSGAGGQHVNKTESAVRATHRPTGLIATAREERSQAMNKKLALARLQSLIAASQHAANSAADKVRWKQHDALERGHPVKVFKGPEFRETA